MKEEIDYKELWFKVCEEKKQLQLENYRIKEELDYIRKKFSSLERIHNSLIQSNWNKHAPHLNSSSDKSESFNKGYEVNQK
jgi:hypothetical protein